MYRSAGANNNDFIEDLCGLVIHGKQTFILGDFNICYISEFSNKVFQVLRSKGFKQIVKYPTHIEGRLIDVVFYFCPDPGTCYEVKQQSQFFTDHDLIQVFRGDY